MRPFLASERASRWDKFLPYIVLGTLLLLWEFLARRELIITLFFPAPTRILENLGEMLMDGSMWANLSATVSRLTIGLVAGIIPGVLLGLAMGWSPRLGKIVDPIIAALHPIPKIAIFPLIMLIFGIGEASKIIAVAITIFFPTLINSMAGVHLISPVYFEIAQNYGAGRKKTFLRVVWPGSLPMVLAGIRIAFAVALIVTIALELLLASEGLGVIIWYAWQTLRTADLYSTLVVIALIGILGNWLLTRIERRLVPWAESNDAEFSSG